jgi:AraC-like DNA-binding protein
MNPDRDAQISRLQTRFRPDGTYEFRDQLKIGGSVATTVVTCTGWLVELYELTAGELYFLRGKVEVRPQSRRFGVFYPRYTLVRPCFANARGRLLGLAGTAGFPETMGTIPFVFETRRARERDSVTEILEGGRDRQFVDANPSASSLSIKARRLIIESHSSDCSIAGIATNLSVSHEHLSRQFRRDFGMSPREYLHQLRTADAPLELARGEAISSISFDSGYGDLSRFYKQFRKFTGTSPAVCRGLVAPRA